MRFKQFQEESTATGAGCLQQGNQLIQIGKHIPSLRCRLLALDTLNSPPRIINYCTNNRYLAAPYNGYSQPLTRSVYAIVF